MTDTYAWWAITAGRELLVALLALECDAPADTDMLTLDLRGLVEDGTVADEYDFSAGEAHARVLHGSHITVERLPALSFRLFHVP